MPGVSSSQPPAGRPVHGAAGRRVATLVVVGTDLPGGDRGAGQAVDQCGLADAGRAQQRHGLAFAAPGFEAGDADRVAGVDRLYQQAGRKPRGAAREIGRGIGKIGLGQHHYRRHVGVAGEGQIALQARDIEVLVAGRHHEQRIDIGGDELHPTAFAGRPALEQAPALETAQRPMRAVEQQPVADRGRGFVVRGVAGERRDARPDPRPGDIQAAAVHRHNPDRHGVLPCVGMEL
jgi:hypothetical protein